MQPNEIAVIWTMYEEQRRLESASSRGHAPASPFIRSTVRGQLRRFVFRGQLGPVGGHPQPDA